MNRNDGEEGYHEDGILIYLTGSHKEQSNGSVLISAALENNTNKAISLKMSLYIQEAVLKFTVGEGKSTNDKELFSVDVPKLLYNLSEEALAALYGDAEPETEEAELPDSAAEPAAEESEQAENPETPEAETASDPAYETLQKGSKGDAVKAMQTHLKALGYLSGSADGDFGKGTEAAVKDYQSAAGLEATGIADNETLTKLFGTALPKTPDLDFKILKIKNNSIGTPEVYVQFTNLTDRTIDRIDFGVYATDAYGDLIRPYGRYDYTSNFYETPVKAGQKTSSDWRWTLYDCDGTVEVRVFIEKYHFKDGETVEVLRNELVYKTYKKNQ